MFFSLNLLEIFPLYIINIFFFLIFFLVLVFSYPIGRYFLNNYCENSLIKCSLFSIVLFASAVSIIINLAPVFAKYVIFIFYLINFFTFAINNRIRNDLVKAITSFKFIIFFAFIIFLLINEIYKYVYVENDKLVYLFDGHHAYYFDPIVEILTSNYFSRVKIFSLYPAEWGAYHFFEASFNSFFLMPIYQSGTIGLTILKNFYLSIFISLFCFSFFINNNFNKDKYSHIILKVLLTILIFVSIFYPKIIYFILTKNFISTLSIIFIIQSLLSKNKNDFLIWAIILSLSSFRNMLISLILIAYYLFEMKYFNLENFILKIKKSLNLPNLSLITLFLFYLIFTFYQKATVTPKFNLLESGTEWWFFSTTSLIIENYKYFLLTLFFLIIIYSLSLKYFYKKKLSIFPEFKKQDFFYFSLVLIIPFICLILSLFKNQIVDIANIEKVRIFFNSFNLKNLSFYFFVPLIWSLILFQFNNLIRYIFLIAIIVYTFLSIFIYNSIIMPAFFTLEIMILFFVFLILLEFKNLNKKYVLSYLFLTTIVISGLFNTNVYRETFHVHKGPKLIFKIDELKELKKKQYICPQNIMHFDYAEYSGPALSGILVRPYYSDISMNDKYASWNISVRFSAGKKQQDTNPCTN